MADGEDRRLSAVTPYVASASLSMSVLIVALLVVPVPPVVRVVGVTVMTALAVSASIGLAVAWRRARGVIPGRVQALASAAIVWSMFTGGMYVLSVLRGRPHPVEAATSGVLAGAFFAAFMYWTRWEPERR